MPKYCILNFKTYNTAASIRAIQKEATREKEYKNIDTGRSHLNEVILGDMNYSKSLKEALRSDYYTKPDRYGRLHQEPKVKAIGVVMTYSPEAEGTFNEREWIEANKAYLEELFPNCPKHFIVHKDESTTHIQGVVIPTTKEGKINKNAYISGRKSLYEIQDKYAEKMAQFGLIRGERNKTQEREDPQAQRVYELTKKVSELERKNEKLVEALTITQEALRKTEATLNEYKEAFWNETVEGHSRGSQHIEKNR